MYKETDAVMSSQKKAAWEATAEQFNAVSCVKCSVGQLKQVLLMLS